MAEMRLEIATKQPIQCEIYYKTISLLKLLESQMSLYSVLRASCSEQLQYPFAVNVCWVLKRENAVKVLREIPRLPSENTDFAKVLVGCGIPTWLVPWCWDLVAPVKPPLGTQDNDFFLNPSFLMLTPMPVGISQ